MDARREWSAALDYLKLSPEERAIARREREINEAVDAAKQAIRMLGALVDAAESRARPAQCSTCKEKEVEKLVADAAKILEQQASDTPEADDPSTPKT